MTLPQLADHEVFEGERCALRLLRMEDCTQRYVDWLRDPLVNQHLETRFSEQTLQSVEAFVRAQRASENSYLFAILDRSDNVHCGNIKLGPVNPRHLYGDVSYFVGDRTRWGKGLATDAIRVISPIAFDRIGVHRLQAGVYRSNVGSARALEKAGYRLEGELRARFVNNDGAREDHLIFGLLADDREGA